ncbi:MAG: lamin tail domain-containing protein [Vicingaceae bacterium]
MTKQTTFFTVLLTFTIALQAYAQQGFTDDFTDGDFTANPAWFGETSKFQIDATNQLQLNDATATSPAYLVTNSSVINDASWEFYVEMDFAPSSSNYGEVYLVSSQQNLTQNLDGYFVRIGGVSGSVDDVSLYRQDGNNQVEIIDGIDGLVGQQPVKVKVTVTKDINGQWELFADTSAAFNNPISQGTVTDQTHSQSTFFGVLCHYTSTRSDKFYFDDFVINGQAFQDTVKPEIDTFMVIGNTQIELHFSELVDIATASNILNYDLDPSLGNPASVVIEASDSSQLTLTYSSGFVSGTNYELEVQNVEDRNANAIETDTLSFFYFDPAPMVDSLVRQGNNQLDLYFSENVEVQSATNLANYNLDPSIGNPSTATINAADSSQLSLVFASNFISGTSYDLEVKNVEDRNGNVMTTDTVDFFYFIPVPANERDLVINEFYPDPTPSNGLPGGEFVEIYNASNKVFDLSGWEIADGTSSQTLPSRIIQPQDYVILCNTSDANAYQAFGTIVQVSLPSLNNSGDDLSLTDNNGNVIDQLSYDLSWYQDASKENGGWSIEQINPETPCIGANNFAASTAAVGGTPGQQNSIFNNSPDLTPPQLVRATALSEDSVLVEFNEFMDSTSVVNGSYTFTTSAVVGQVFNQPPSYDKALLVLSTPLDSGIVNTLLVNNVSDCAGNVISGNDSSDVVLPAQASFRDVVINEFFSDPSPSFGLPTGEFIELYNASNKIFNLEGWQIEDASSGGSLNSQIFKPGDYIILCPTGDVSAYQSFGTTMGVPSFPSLNNSGDQIKLFDAQGSTIDRLSYSIEWYQDAVKDDGGWTLEQINPFTECSGKNNFIASNNIQGGTPGVQNSVYDTTADQSAPELLSAQALSVDSVLLRFNEPLDTVSVLSATYTFSTSATVGAVQNRFPSYTEILLLLNSPLDSGVVNTITVTNLTDCPGNQIGSQNQAEIVVPAVPNYRDVVINEFLCKPDPEIGLPDAEFIELYNASQKIFDLSNWTLGDRSTISTLGNLIFSPGDYIIICSEGSEAAFVALGPTQGQSSFPSLTDSDDILLRDANGNLVDFVRYTPEWYQDESKADGGYTIEQINPNTACSGQLNYRSSNNSSGGTPGMQNSVFDTALDQTPPELLSAEALTANTVLLRFNELLDSTSVLNATYTISRGQAVSLVSNQAPLYNSVLLQLSSPLDTGVIGTISVTNLTDCPGNPIGSENQAEVLLPNIPNYRNVVINEIMADPSPQVGLPNGDFIELFNASQKTFDLSNWTLSNGSSFTALGNTLFKPGDYITICSSELASSLSAFGPSQGRSDFPSFTSAADEVILRDANGKMIDYINYTDQWYGNDTKKDGGYTLEQINPYLPCSDRNNFFASNAFSGGTPGNQNSIFSDQADVTPPRLNRVLVFSENTMEIRFNEGLDTAAVSPANFSFSTPTQVLSVSSKPLDPSSITLLLDTPLDTNVVLTLTISNLSDCSGNALRNPIHANFGLPVATSSTERSDIVINEILFNPRSGGSDFVELYNRSQKIISLEGWMMANWDDAMIANREIIIEEPYLVLPGQYVGLTENIDNIVKEYPNTVRSSFYEVEDLPSYIDAEGGVYVLNTSNELIDGFLYDEDMHFEVLNSMDGVSLERLDPNRSSEDRGNFHSAAESVGFATPGFENSQYFPETQFKGEVSLDPELFSPDNDGYQDILNINYQFNAPGFVANVKIYDRGGRLIKDLIKNELLGAKGTFSWDGVTEDGSKARVGIYVLYFEAFNPSGDQEVYKETFVVAAQLD